MTRGLTYFALVFGIGCVLGPIRVLWIAPRVGPRWAELLEAPIMLVAIAFSAGWVVRRFPAARGGAHLRSGLLALALLLAAEFGVVLGLRGPASGNMSRAAIRSPVPCTRACCSSLRSCRGPPGGAWYAPATASRA